MKRFWIVFLMLAAVSCDRSVTLSDGDRLSLDKNWQLTREGGSETCEAIVPSTVAGSLYQAGFFGEGLLEGKRYAEVDKAMFDDVWTYKTEVSVKPVRGQHVELVFDGLDYRADIYLGGKQIASSDTTFGVFRRWSYDVTPLLGRGKTLEVRLRRAQPGDLNHGFVDWNPRPLDESMGIVRPVTLHATGAVSVEDVFVIPDLEVPSLTKADLKVRVTLRNREAVPVEGTLVLNLAGVGECSLPVSLAADATAVVTLTPEQADVLHIDNPRVWWSYDLGTPELYSLTAEVRVAGAVSDRKGTDFGIRKIESRLTDKNYRQFTLNGKDILIKGAGWSDHIFLLDTPESMAQQVQYVKDMNLNCIRFENIWGKDDTIYDLCDREGVLALVGWSCQWEWQDYCGLPEVDPYGCINGPELENLAVAFFHDQVVRLHNHPAVIGWMTGSDRIPNPGLEARYLAIYQEEDYRPYICSAKNLQSAAGWSGTKMEGPYEYVAPDYWYFDTQAGGAFGFNTETGIGANLPQLESLRKMIPAEALWPLSDVWNYHCTASSSAMNSVDVLNRTLSAQYGPADNLEDFVRKAHAVDYDGTRAMFEAFRVRMPGTTGIVQWMLNSAWPSLYWQLYDWYGAPTAGYYGTKKACEPDQLIFNYQDRKVYAVSESPEAKELTATLQVFDGASQLIGQEKRAVKTDYRSVKPVFDMRRYDGRPHFVALKLTDKDGQVVADNFYCIGSRNNTYDWKKSNWYVTPITASSDLRFAFWQKAADVDLSVEPGDGIYTVTLVNKSPVIAYMNILKAVDGDGNLVVPAFWSDNFFPLLPGETRSVTCRTDAPDVRFRLNS